MPDLEHPDITHALLTGYPDDPKWPRCPECGKECEQMFVRNGLVVGCDICTETIDAWSYEAQ